MAISPVMVRGEYTLIGLGHARCGLSDRLVDSAAREVTGRRLEHADLGVRWGYLLGLERDATVDSFPATWQLSDALYQDVVRPIADRELADFRFSFCKAYSGPVLRETEGVHYEGLHIDTHPGLTESTDLLRVLINVGERERRFRFGDATRIELERDGLYDRSSFRADHVEPRVPIREIRIPGRNGDRVSFLVFWASVVPHVGITESPGYFLLSFEAVVSSRWTAIASPTA